MFVIAFCIGKIFPETQSKGRVPDDSDLLNKQQSWTEIKSAALFSRNEVTLSGP